MDLSVAIIGGGPTAVYLLQALIEQGCFGRMVVFDRGPRIGVGMPYDPRQNDPALLANIASREIPSLGVSLADWANARPTALRADYPMTWPMDPFSFPTRVLLGEYFAEGAQRLADNAAPDVSVDLRPRHEVQDIVPGPDGVDLRMNGDIVERFDRVVLATGHTWPGSPESGAGRYQSPWPTGNLRVPADARIAVLGSSLSAIDAAVAIAMRAGQFRDGPGGLRFTPHADHSLAITFFSRGGVLPEADFFYLDTAVPLTICTRDAVRQAVAQGPGGLLDRVFDLMRAELTAADRFHALLIGLQDLSADDFADAYFSGRRSLDPFAYARANLDETRENAARRRTVAWRLAILRMHEVVAEAVPFLSHGDRARFDRGLRRLFTDNYAAVPLASVERLIALNAAGVLEVERIGDSDSFAPAETGVTLTQGAKTRHFTTFIDARGQRALNVQDLPFPSLRGALAEVGVEAGPLPLDADLRLTPPFAGHDRIFCAAIPFLLQDRPFVQGLVEASRLACTVATAMRPACGHADGGTPDGQISLPSAAPRHAPQSSPRPASPRACRGRTSLR